MSFISWLWQTCETVQSLKKELAIRYCHLWRWCKTLRSIPLWTLSKTCQSCAHGNPFILPQSNTMLQFVGIPSVILISHHRHLSSCQIIKLQFGYVIAWVRVHSLAVAIAAGSSSFHLLATSGAKGSSGFGAPRRAWMESRMVRIWRAGDQLPIIAISRWNMIWANGPKYILLSTSKQIRPSLSIFGW